jgi:cytoskeletal protein RodZ
MPSISPSISPTNQPSIKPTYEVLENILDNKDKRNKFFENFFWFIIAGIILIIITIIYFILRYCRRNNLGKNKKVDVRYSINNINSEIDTEYNTLGPRLENNYTEPTSRPEGSIVNTLYQNNTSVEREGILVNTTYSSNSQITSINNNNSPTYFNPEQHTISLPGECVNNYPILPVYHTTLEDADDLYDVPNVL